MIGNGSALRHIIQKDSNNGIFPMYIFYIFRSIPVQFPMANSVAE